MIQAFTPTLVVKDSTPYNWGANLVASTLLTIGIIKAIDITQLSRFALHHSLPTTHVVGIASITAFVVQGILLISLQTYLKKTRDQSEYDQFFLDYKITCLNLSAIIAHTGTAIAYSLIIPMNIPTIALLALTTLGSKMLINAAQIFLTS